MKSHEEYARPKPNWIDVVFLCTIVTFILFALYTGIPGD